jgi:hypothetical protein
VILRFGSGSHDTQRSRQFDASAGEESAKSSLPGDVWPGAPYNEREAFEKFERGRHSASRVRWPMLSVSTSRRREVLNGALDEEISDTVA